MHLVFTIAEIRQNTPLFGLIGKFHEAFAEAEVFEFTVCNLDLFVDKPIANAVHHIATFRSRHDAIPLHMHRFRLRFVTSPESLRLGATPQL